MSSIVGLEMPNAWRTGQLNDANFDISANQLNLTANREMWVPSGTVDWGTTLHQNAADPITAQDLATKSYVDTNGGNLWSTFPAQQDVDYVSTYKNINLIEPTDPQDSATKNYVDTNAGATDLDGLTDVTITTPALNEILQFNGSLWVNQALVVPAGNQIIQDDSSVTVIDPGAGGLVNFTIDNVIRMFLDASVFDVGVPIDMNSQQINQLGTPSVASDAATKDYVDTEIINANIPSVLDDLSDVTITSPLVNQILVNNGAGQWVNQLLTKSQLPSEIAYEDETNAFTLTQQFNSGLQLGAAQVLDMQGSNMIDTAYIVFDEQGVAPPDPAINDFTLYMSDGSDFNSTDPLVQVLIDRGGTIEKKPVVTSETVFALREFSNGMFTEETGVELVTDGGIGIRVQQFNEANRANSFEVVLEGQLRIIGSPDTSPGVGNTIDLTVGTDIAPTTHRVWTELVAGVPTMMSSTVAFPSTGDFAVVGKFTLQSQASVLADGPYADNAPDNEIFDDAVRGHLAHINDRLVELDAAYVSGIDITVTPAVGGGTAAEVSFTSTGGKAFELHLEDIELFDSSTGINLVENEGTQSAQEVTRINNIGTDLIGLTCANGTTVIGNNDDVNLVLYTVHIDSEPNQTNYGINLPFDTYLAPAEDADAIADINGWAVKNVPLNSRGTTLLIAEVVVKITGGGTTFEVLAVKDLRGQIPGAATSGGGGGGGAGELNDLSDVTINSPALNESLIFNGAGLWVNKLTPQFETANIWTNYQDFDDITEPAQPTAGTIRFFVETIDASNDALFCWLNQDGIIQKVRIA